MKRFPIFLLLLVLLAASCEDDFFGLNDDVKNPADVPGEALFTAAQKRLVDQMVSTNVNFNVFRLFAQQWTETTYPDESQYDIVTREIPEQHWAELYRYTLRNLQEAATLIEADEVPALLEAEKQNKLAITEIMQVYTWSVLVETFGDIPYSEALDVTILTPKYDDAETIYRDLITRLDAAIGQLDPEAGSFGSSDNIYQGDVEKWKRFANSLKMRMGLVMADVDATLAKSTVESAVASGVLQSNADNATMEYQSAPPNTNPLYIDLVASGRQDFVAANTLIDAMDSLNDPRMQYFFDENLPEYEGGVYGTQNTFDNATHIAPEVQDPSFPGTIMSYSEVEFMLAEAVERGFNVGGTAEEHYNAAITASVLEWGGTQAEADAYLAQPDVDYATAEGPWQRKIGVQKWIALYNRGYEAWLSWRLLDYPTLVAPPDAVSDIPVRMTYPIVDQTLNGANLQSAATAIGGDDVATQLFFDIR